MLNVTHAYSVLISKHTHTGTLKIVNYLMLTELTKRTQPDHDRQSACQYFTSKTESAENIARAVSRFPLLQNSMTDILRSGQNSSAVTQNIHGAKGQAFINLRSLNEVETHTHNASSSLPKSPFLPQISPSMPTGSRSFISKQSPCSIQNYMNPYYGRMEKDFIYSVGPNTNNLNSDSKDWYTKLFPAVTKTVAKGKDQEKEYKNGFVGSCPRVDKFPPTHQVRQNQKVTG